MAVRSAICLFACALAFGADDGTVEGARVAIAPRTVPQRKTGPPASIRVDSRLVLIPVTVTDPFGAPYSGLARDAFKLFEDGVEQQVKYFTSEDAPVSLGVVFDASRSMTGKLEHSREAISRFFRSSVSGDEFFLVEFNDAPRVLCRFTSDSALIEKTLIGIEPRNWTALLDAVYMAIQEMRHAHNPRKALLILSDGGDNNSRYTESEMKSLVREADVCIYSVGLTAGGVARRHVRLLKELSDETGGRLWEVEKSAGLPDAIASFSAAIRNQYVLGYFPSNTQNNGLYRKVQVRLSPPPDVPRLRASWRAGYFAPEAP